MQRAKFYIAVLGEPNTTFLDPNEAGEFVQTQMKKYNSKGNNFFDSGYVLEVVQAYTRKVNIEKTEIVEPRIEDLRKNEDARAGEEIEIEEEDEPEPQPARVDFRERAEIEIPVWADEQGQVDRLMALNHALNNNR